MNELRSVDLNLLVILEALIEEAHVTRAAGRLGLSQPAASNALERLRHLFRDPLLEKRGRHMRLTPTADAMRPALKAVLAAVRDMLHVQPLDLANIRRTVRIVMADMPAVALLAKLQRRLARSVPGVTLAVLPWHGGVDALRQLSGGAVELVLSVLPSLDPANFCQTKLFDERYLVAMRHGHPAAASFDLNHWLAHPHVVVSGNGESTTPIDTELAARDRIRQVAMVVPSFLMVAPLLVRSDLIALLPSSCVPLNDPAPLATFAPPIPIDGFRLDLAWHRRNSYDAVIRHVAAEIVMVAQC